MNYIIYIKWVEGIMSGDAKEDYANQFSFDVIKELCKTEPYLSRGIIYYKNNDQHNFVGYSIPEGTNCEKLDPLFTVQGPCLDEAIHELVSAIRDTEMRAERDWIFLPYEESDMKELEKRLDIQGLLCPRANKCYFHRKRPLTSYILQPVVEEKKEETEKPVLAASETISL